MTNSIYAGAPVLVDPYIDVPPPEDEWCPEGPVPGSDPYARELRTADSSTVPRTDPEPHGLGEYTVPSSVVTVLEPGTAGSEPSAVPGSRKGGTEPGTVRYVDVAALLDGTLPEPPAPDLLRRSDSNALFYAGQVNLLFGDPESGKTWVALAAVEEALREGGTALGAWVSNGFSGAGARRERIGAVRWALRWRSAGKFWWVCFTFAAG